jgi:4-diphosphocytidyl-2-C-methyl-D-erythritol kinase
MPIFAELARAKINLTLNVLGRRPDGYHELESLVAFADVGDIITLDTDAPVGVSVSGPFATALVGENLIATTLQRLAACPALRLGAVHLEKRLPVAAGIGGGSADAAAVMRAVQRANADLAAAQTLPWSEIAASLGADVPVCFANQAAWMRGIGERLEPLPGLPRLHAVLVNALGEVPPDKTASVFRALNAPPLNSPPVPPVLPPNAADEASSRAAHLSDLWRPGNEALGGTAPVESNRALLEFMRSRGNDLEAATQQVVPDLGTVLNRLRTASVETLAGTATVDIERTKQVRTRQVPTVGSTFTQEEISAARHDATRHLAAPAVVQSLVVQTPVAQPLVAMSGAGPTCFGIFDTVETAAAVAATLRQSQPSWWVAACDIG